MSAFAKRPGAVSPFAKSVSEVRPNPLRGIAEASMTPGIISFAGGFPAPDLFDIDGLRAAAEQVVKSYGPLAFQYIGTQGHPKLRQAIATLMSQRSTSVTDEDLLLTTGSQQGIDLIARCFLDRGDSVLVERPTFVSALHAFRVAGAEIVGVEMDADGVLPDSVEQQLKTAKDAGKPIKFVYLVPSLGNPTGRVLSLARRLKLLELAVSYQTYILEDDPYSELWAYTPPPLSLLALSPAVEGARRFIVHLSSLSKICAPGLRLGWIAADPAVIGRATTIKQAADIHTSTFDQLIAATYLASGRLTDHLPQIRSGYKARADLLSGALTADLGDQIVFEPPVGGMFIWGRLADHRDSTDFTRLAFDRGVAVMPGDPFFADTPEVGWLRLSYSNAAPADITEGVVRLSRAMTS